MILFRGVYSQEDYFRIVSRSKDFFNGEQDAMPKDIWTIEMVSSKIEFVHNIFVRGDQSPHSSASMVALLFQTTGNEVPSERLVKLILELLGQTNYWHLAVC